MCNMFREGKGRIFGPLALCGFASDILKGRREKHEPKGNLGSLHKIPARRHSLSIKRAYKALLGCTCASGSTYTSDSCRRKKKDTFLRTGIFWTCSKQFGSQKISDFPLRKKKYFDKEKGLDCSLKLNSEKNGGEKKQNQCHCCSNHFKPGW